MKKTFILAGLAIVAALAACNKIDVATTDSSDDIIFDISVESPYGPDTKAIKTGWTSGDKFNLWFGPQKSHDEGPTVTLVYDGEKWSVDGEVTEAQKSKIASATSFNVLYESGNDLSKYTISFFKFTPPTSNGGTRVCCDLTLFSNNVPFTLNGNVVSANISDWKFATQIQITVTDVPSDFTTANTSLLDIFGWMKGLFYLDMGTSGFSPCTGRVDVAPIEGSQSNSLVFYCGRGNSVETGGAIYLSLTNGTTNKYFKKVLKADLPATTDKALKAIVIPFSEFKSS